MVTAASAGPWLGPSAAFRSARAAAKGSAPNGTMSPVRANFWSGVTKTRKICCPCGVLNTAVTSVKPCASAGLISAIFDGSLGGQSGGGWGRRLGDYKGGEGAQQNAENGNAYS